MTLNKEGDNMSKSMMIDYLIHNLGFEHPATIGFARYCDYNDVYKCRGYFGELIERLGLEK